MTEKLTYNFFVLGTMQRGKYGAAPILQFNKTNQSGINASSWFEKDLLLLEKKIGACIFHYGPRLWMLGEIEPLKDLQAAPKRNAIVKRIISEYPAIELDTNTLFYRIRLGPKLPSDPAEYDSPPLKLSSFGRMDSENLSVLYASQDLGVCFHECRVTAEDDLYAATLSPTRPLRVLNLDHLLDEGIVTEFEGLDLAVNMLFLAGKHSYEITREIASIAHSSGFDGISYPSYFSLLRTGAQPFETQFGISNRRAAVHLKLTDLANYEKSKMISNIALFGKPIKEGKVKVNCINRIFLGRVEYDGHFGPVGYS